MRYPGAVMTRPAEGTPEYALWVAAIEVAMAAPLKRKAHTTSAGIYWPKVTALREALDALGIDWRAAKASEGSGGSPAR